ncbi:MAG TPA: hypothetical protein VJT50_06830 [Pyrinomonadaceae bacterium]|nr:hypothetical protein [Pyrinomonadaceae bacterium]
MQKSAEDRRRDDQASDSDATSKETVEDISQDEASSNSGSAGPAPSPDGAFDEPKKTNDSGPM